LNFAKLLAGHDWSYQYSEDMRVWKAGSAQRKEINQFVENHAAIRSTLQAMHDTANPFKNGEYRTSAVISN
tara:strand:- start:44361 stop:44573 length:213 start_codon:yes stop_codon:yes gene_type:complete